jgi:MarR family transcriptional regulator, multiple antibiotic resistance protein MarR
VTDLYDPDTTDPRDTIAPLMKRAAIELSFAVEEAFGRDKELAPFEMSAAQFGILARLHFHETASAGELCKTMKYDRGAMSRMLDRLEEKGLIRRVRREGERRMITLELTPRGEKLFPRMKACVISTINHLVRGIPEGDVRCAEGVLRRMLENAS